MESEFPEEHQACKVLLKNLFWAPVGVGRLQPRTPPLGDTLALPRAPVRSVPVSDVPTCGATASLYSKTSFPPQEADSPRRPIGSS